MSTKKTIVKAKFSVEQVTTFAYGEVIGMKAVHATPPTPEQLVGKKKLEDTENTTYSKSIPSAEVKLQVNKESKDFGKFYPGREVYVTFEISPEEKK